MRGIGLQGAGDVRGMGIPPALPLFHLGHRVGGLGQDGQYLIHLLLAAQAGFLALDAQQMGLKALLLSRAALQFRLQRPVLLGYKGLDLALPLHHQAQSHGLHATGGERLAHSLAQDGADLVAHQAVQHAAALLGVDQVTIQAPGIPQGLLDGRLCYLIEGDASRLILRQARDLAHVPGDRLAFPVGIHGQIDEIAFPGRLPQLADHVLLFLVYLVGGAESVLDIHAQFFGGQVADVPHGGQDPICPAQVLGDGLGFGRRLYDDEMWGHLRQLLIVSA